MRALIISDSQEETELLEYHVKQAGYDCITYNWVLKAMDNLLELSPELVIINAIDYPKHWKVLVQYASAWSKTKNINFVLLASKTYFDEEEQNKARFLGVKGYITDFSESNVKILNQLINPVEEVCSEEKSSILFIHPVYGSIYTGSVISMDSNGFVVSPDKSVELNTGDYLSDMALKTGDMIRSIKAEITQIKDNLLEMSFR